ncbi:nucleobindin-2-like isoform X2 [Limulus polyphemus]|uniref:Nucleobindin-2-like isoform X2 n=1 Tax=Limulus polyphemus TaxID=6850 RepID=A0ABM1SS03_LIMPO|nr:nucleobindin-2-like isoform X2 [Limulus polyphemus]
MKVFVVLVALCLLDIAFSAPHRVEKKKETERKEKETNEDIDDFGLEYGRYLQQVVQALEEDKEFAKKLENISSEEIKKGEVARELEFVKHSVRSKLDELKRMEVERLRRLTMEEVEQNELGLYRDEDGHLLPAPPNGRKWHTQSRPSGGKGFNRKNSKVPVHIDPLNTRTFEVEDLKRLIQTATNDLEELDRKRREEFKRYEMEKEHRYRESLQNLKEEEKRNHEKKHQEMKNKHQEHPRIHHPGSKPQLEQVWEERDHMSKDEFDPRVFFAMHDINGDGYLDEDEVEAILSLEVKKMYDPNNPEDDPVEMMEEYNRMREHIYNEADRDKDKRISQKEFMELTKKRDFEEDDGWKGIDEQNIFTEEEFKEYERQRAIQMQKHFEAQRQAAINQGSPSQYIQYPPPPQYGIPSQHGVAQQHRGLPPQHLEPHAIPPKQYYGYQLQDQYGAKQQFQGTPQFQGVPHYQQGGLSPQQQHFQGVPQYQQGALSPQQQQFQGVPQYQQGALSPQQQNLHGVPHYQQGGLSPQQQNFQGVPQYQQGAHSPQQQQFQGVPQYQQGAYSPQQQQFQGVPQYQQGAHSPQQKHFQGVPQHLQDTLPPKDQFKVLPQHQQGIPLPQQQQGVPSQDNRVPQKEIVTQHQQQQEVSQQQQGIASQEHKVPPKETVTQHQQPLSVKKPEQKSQDALSQEKPDAPVNQALQEPQQQKP